MAGELSPRTPILDGAQDGAILLDAMGTLVHLDEPVARLRAALGAHAGLDVGEATAADALRAEIAFYRAHLHTAVDAASLDALRARCAAAMRPALGLVPSAPAALERGPGTASPSDAALTAALLEAIVFRAYDEVPGALRGLRAAGWRLVVVSNWDVSLDDRLAETGLRGLVDATVTSVEVGAPKPDAAIFARGLALAGVPAAAAWHVGDDLEADVGGALAAGVRPVLLDRDGSAPAPSGVAVIAGLDALPGLIAATTPYA